MKKTNIRPYDPADYLNSEEMINTYLGEIIADGDPDEIVEALGHVARARGGMTRLARDTGLGRQNLYRALQHGSRPRFDTVLKVLHALGVSLHAQAQEPRKAA